MIDREVVSEQAEAEEQVEAEAFGRNEFRHDEHGMNSTLPLLFRPTYTGRRFRVFRVVLRSTPDGKFGRGESV